MPRLPALALPPALALALLTVLAAPLAAAERAAELVRLGEPAGLARLLRPEAPARPPLVVVLPDALGEDGRSEHYLDSLLARGIATLALGMGEAVGGAGGDTDPAAQPAAVAPALAWALATGFAPERIGLLGFGLGGRAALAADAGLPVVALYPGCAGLPVPRDGAALVMQGAEAAEGCVAADPALRLVAGAGHAWDAPGGLWPSPGPLLPDPAGGARLRARTDPAVTLEAAEAVADWFEARLAGGMRRASR